jgi:hypothetical protein
MKTAPCLQDCMFGFGNQRVTVCKVVGRTCFVSVQCSTVLHMEPERNFIGRIRKRSLIEELINDLKYAAHLISVASVRNVFRFSLSKEMEKVLENILNVTSVKVRAVCI